ncbi:phage tail tube protein [Breznakiella homolactica]|uniref:Phage tail tube protein n=1 Tax=Breznakiella homolactica TaxID=2798577 RepID=A0A7T7XPV3_9SPIR|nr:phage tail tube protein [Breznakiella homolactica]QQO10321.1 phage tail tube protein [Breznakiella homolactica]
MILNKVKRVISSVLGELPLKEGGGTFKPGAYKRETQLGEVAENTGYTESPTAAELSLTLNASLDPQDFRDISNDTLTIILSGGSEHTMPNAWVTDAVELGTGELKVTYQSAKSEKLV